AEQVPEAGRVGPARDEARDLSALGNQLVLADEALDPVAQLVHPSIVPRKRASGRGARGSCPSSRRGAGQGRSRAGRRDTPPGPAPGAGGRGRATRGARSRVAGPADRPRPAAAAPLRASTPTPLP